MHADGSSRWQIEPALAPEAAKTYAEHYSRLDHVLAAAEKGPVGAVRTGSELILPEEMCDSHTLKDRRLRLSDLSLDIGSERHVKEHTRRWPFRPIAEKKWFTTSPTRSTCRTTRRLPPLDDALRLHEKNGGR